MENRTITSPKGNFAKIISLPTSGSCNLLTVEEILLIEMDDEIKKLKDRVKSLEEAITPSPNTKYFHNGEHKLEFQTPHPDEPSSSYTESKVIDWTTIKEIMGEIKMYADGVRIPKGDRDKTVNIKRGRKADSSVVQADFSIGES